MESPGVIPDVLMLDKVVRQTITAIEEGRDQLYEIAENTRQERDRLREELVQVRKETISTIDTVDNLEKEEKEARWRLMNVSKNFNRYSEQDMQAAYEKARQLQIDLGRMREREAQLRRRRDDLQRSLRKMEDTVTKAENLVTQMGVALNFLDDKVLGVANRVEELHQRQFLAIRIIKAQEEERKRVAREIHDGPAQSLANLVLRAEICEKLLYRDPASVGQELRELQDLCRASLKDIRKIIFDLRPMALDDLGLVPTLRRYLAEFSERSGLTIDFVNLGKECRLSSSLEVTLFRIVQESINNVHRHSGAHTAMVKVEIAATGVTLQVTDDGSGFEPEGVLKATERESFGLMGLQERVELLDGELDIRSKPGSGTTIWVSIPIGGNNGIE